MSEQEINIKFVQEVEKYPCLYDYRLKDYARKDVTEMAWDHVGNIFNLSGSQCKEKWKNLRTVFARNLKPSRGSTTRAKKPYYLADAMQFAIPFIKIQPTVKKETEKGRYLTEEENEEPNYQNSPPYTQSFSLPIHFGHTSPPASQSCSSPPQSPQSFSPPRSKRSRKSKEASEIAELLEYGETDQSKVAKKMFLLSLLPELYSMNDAQMRAFRIKVATLIDDVMNASQVTELSKGKMHAKSRSNSNSE